MPNRRKLPRADGRDRTNTALTRIRYEVAVMKRCNHDHIVRLIEVIDDPRSQAVFLGEYSDSPSIKFLLLWFPPLVAPLPLDNC
jgi:hypothetical protein